MNIMKVILQTPVSTSKGLRELRAACNEHADLLFRDLFPTLLDEGLKARRLIQNARKELKFNGFDDLKRWTNAEILEMAEKIQAEKTAKKSVEVNLSDVVKK